MTFIKHLIGENKMKHFIVCLFSVFFLLIFGITSQAADEAKKTPGKSVGASVVDEAKDLKTGAVNLYQESKDAVVRDAKAMKEDIPKGLKEAKDSAVQQSKEIKEGAAKEFKEIRDNMANPSLKPKTETK